jgi:hypothetical protein
MAKIEKMVKDSRNPSSKNTKSNFIREELPTLYSESPNLSHLEELEQSRKKISRGVSNHTGGTPI